MSNNRRDAGTPLVQVRVERLFDVINTLIDAGLADAVIKKFKDEHVTMSLEQANAFKRFIGEQIADEKLIDTEATVDLPGRFNTLSVRKIRAVMPLDFDHCTVQYEAQNCRSYIQHRRAQPIFQITEANAVHV